MSVEFILFLFCLDVLIQIPTAQVSQKDGVLEKDKEF